MNIVMHVHLSIRIPILQENKTSPTAALNFNLSNFIIELSYPPVQSVVHRGLMALISELTVVVPRACVR